MWMKAEKEMKMKAKQLKQHIQGTEESNTKFNSCAKILVEILVAEYIRVAIFLKLSINFE